MPPKNSLFRLRRGKAPYRLKGEPVGSPYASPAAGYPFRRRTGS